MAEEIGIKIKIEGDAQSIKKIHDLQIGLDQLQKELKAVNKAEKDNIITATEASKKRAELNLKIGATRNALRDANVELLKQNDALRKSTGLTGLFKDGLKDIGSSLATAALRFFALNKAIQVLGSSIKTMKEFEQQMAKVKAVTGANEEQFTQLKKSAIDLSGAFTALEIGKLQEEFAKLGFTTDDILAATEATIQLSVATGEDLANSAKTLAATLNGFGLAATDTQKVVDIMAKSFNDSALGLESFSNAMSQVAPVAKVAGSSIEEATALIEVLVNAGFEGGKAGTALRKIFIEVSEQGISLDQAFSQIRNSVDPLTEAVKLFGVEAASQAVTLATNTEELAKFEEGLKNAGGTAAQTAGIVGDTLAGDVDKLSASWDKFILSIESGDGVINQVLRSLSQDFASLLNSFSDDTIDRTLSRLTAMSVNGVFDEEEIRRFNSEFEFLDESIKLASGSVTKLKFEQQALNSDIARFTEELKNTKDEDAIEVLNGKIAVRRQLYRDINKEIEKAKKVETEKAEAEKKAADLKNQQLQIEKAFTAQINKESVSQLKARLEQEVSEEEKAIIKKALKRKEAAEKELEERKKANESVLSETVKLNAALEENTLQRTLKEITIERDANIKKIEESKANEKLKADAINAIKTTALSKEKKAREVDSKEQFDKELKALEEHNKALVLLTENGSKEEQEAQVKAIEAKRDFELQNAELTADQKIIIEQEAADAIAAINKTTADKQIEESKRVEEAKREILQQSIEVAGQFATTLVNLAGQRADREKQIELDNLKAKNEQGLITQEEYETKRKEIEKKAFEDKKKRDLAFVAIELAKQIVSIQTAAAANPSNAVTFGAAGISQAAILTGLAVASAGIQSAAILSQQFAEGGYTGDGFGKKDSTGFKQAGVVHEGEYVAPKWVLGTREGSELVNRLESIRTGKPNLVPNFGYANGGFVKQQQAQLNMDEMEFRITKAVVNSIGAIPVINNAVDTANVARKVSNVQAQATFG